MADTEKPCCSFCGAEKSPTVPLIAGNDGRICEACVNLAHQVVSSWGQRRKLQQLAPQLRALEVSRDQARKGGSAQA